jgi:hypothetical protein
MEKLGNDKVALNTVLYRYMRDRFSHAVRVRHDGSMASVIAKFVEAYVEGTVTLGTLEGYRDVPKKKERVLPPLVITEDLEAESKRDLATPTDPEPESTNPNAWMSNEQRRNMLIRLNLSEEDIEATMKEEGRC